MNLDAFKESLSEKEAPPDLSLALQALWQEAKGDWNGAHAMAQAEKGEAGAWVHAYLHRKEGDISNAAYWYRRAERKVCELPLDEEWEEIVEALLADR